MLLTQNGGKATSIRSSSAPTELSPSSLPACLPTTQPPDLSEPGDHFTSHHPARLPPARPTGRPTDLLHDRVEGGPERRLALEQHAQVAHQAQHEQLVGGHVRVHHVQLDEPQLPGLLGLQALKQLVAALGERTAAEVPFRYGSQMRYTPAKQQREIKV